MLGILTNTRGVLLYRGYSITTRRPGATHMTVLYYPNIFAGEAQKHPVLRPPTKGILMFLETLQLYLVHTTILISVHRFHSRLLLLSCNVFYLVVIL